MVVKPPMAARRMTCTELCTLSCATVVFGGEPKGSIDLHPLEEKLQVGLQEKQSHNRVKEVRP